MGNCPAKPADPDGASPLGARSPSDVAASKLALRVSTNVDPVMLRTRGAGPWVRARVRVRTRGAAPGVLRRRTPDAAL
eukprot:scaffold124921_cov59-Phaeocystis_antarctica.AAC.7